MTIILSIVTSLITSIIVNRLYAKYVLNIMDEFTKDISDHTKKGVDDIIRRLNKL